MAVISIRNFGGLVPMASARALPAEAASVAQNLFARTTELRPLLSATTYSAVLSTTYNPITLYRLQHKSDGSYNTDPSTGWGSYSDHRYLAKWPIDDDNTDRTTVSSATGTFAPRVITATGTDRLLGVPPPIKPVIVVTPGDYFTEEDRIALMAEVRAQVVAALLAALTRAKVGAVYTADAIEGYLETGAEEADPPTLDRLRVYRYSGYQGTISDRYTSGTDADVAWVRSSGYGGWMQAGASPSWMGGAGTWHYAVSYPAYGAGWKFDAAGAETALAALDHVSPAHAASLAAFYEDWMDPGGVQLASVIQALRDAVTRMEEALDTRPTNSYDATESSALVDDAVEATANRIYDALYRYSGTYIQDSGA